MSNIKETREALEKAGVSKADAAKMSTRELIEKAEEQGVKTDSEDVATATKFLR